MVIEKPGAETGFAVTVAEATWESSPVAPAVAVFLVVPSAAVDE